MPTAQSIANAKYRRTPKGALQRAYELARRRIRTAETDRKHARYAGLAICDREEFYKAALESESFWTVYKRWRDGGFRKNDRPTPDRQDTSRGYLVENIVWETYYANTLRALP